MPTIRQETYTTAEPDGTLVTTTTKTQTRYVRERELGFGRGTINEAYCCRPAGILRILEIVSLTGTVTFHHLLFRTKSL